MTSSARGSKNFGMARSNMDKKKADEEIRKKDVQLQELTAKYQSLQSSHKKIMDMKDELEQIYSSKYKASPKLLDQESPRNIIYHSLPIWHIMVYGISYGMVHATWSNHFIRSELDFGSFKLLVK